MDYRLVPPKRKKLSTDLGALTYSIRPGSPLWVAVEADDLPVVQALANEIVQSGVNVFSVEAAVPDKSGGVALVNLLGLACEYRSVEAAVWLYRQIPSFLPVERFDLSTRGFLSIIEMSSADKGLVEIARRCLEWNFTRCHECLIQSGAPLKPLDAGPIAAALFMDIGLRLYAAHEQKLLGAHIQKGPLSPRATGIAARL